MSDKSDIFYQGLLYSVWSRNPPVFTSPVFIRYLWPPAAGEAFLFRLRSFGYGNLSNVAYVVNLWVLKIIRTRNSLYVLVGKR